MSLTREAVLDALRQVQDPDLHKDIVSLGFIKKAEVDGGKVDVTINLTTPACPVKDQMREQAEKLITALPGVQSVEVEMTATVPGAASSSELGKDIANIVAVSSGKGGVGKSTVTVNLACALARTGAQVGILDCDVYGPDVPMMMGLSGRPERAGTPDKPKISPKVRHGVKTMSIGYLQDDDQPTIWRGPMLHKAIEQFIGDVEWGELDYLLVDMPPGTGDAQLSLAQLVNLAGAILVTTPQAVSTYDVNKAISMFATVKVPVLGIIENMAGYAIEGWVEGAQAGQKVHVAVGDRDEVLELDAEGRFRTVAQVFGTGGAEQLAERHDFPLLGRVPLNPAVRVGGDAGDPIVVASPGSHLAEIFNEIAGKAAQRIAIRAFSSLPVLE